MISIIFTYLNDILESGFLQRHDYDNLSHYDKIQLVDKIIFALKNGILKIEKPFFQNLIHKIAIDQNRIISKIFAKEIIKIKIDSDLLKSLAFNNLDIAKELLRNSKSLTNLDLITICTKGIDEIKLIESLVKRKSITEMTADYIIFKGNVKIVKQLLINKTAEISTNSFLEIIYKFGENNAVTELLISRIVGDELILNNFLIQIDNKFKYKIYKKLANFFPHKILYYTTCKSIYSFNYTLCPNSVEYLSNQINLYLHKGMLNEQFFLKLLCKGDVYSFIYGLSKYIETNYFYLKKLITTDFISNDYEEILISVGFSYTSIKASQRILKILYEICLREHVNSQNFVGLLRERIFKITNTNGPDEALSYIISIIT